MKPVTVNELVAVVKGELLCGDGNKLVTFVTTNSREAKEGALFVPIIGERFDGHDFISDAFSQGAYAAFTQRDQVDGGVLEHDGKAFVLIKVTNTLFALQDFAAYYRRLFDHIPVIGITGSVGKTTTKEMVSAALSTKYKVLKTRGNLNSQIGLSLMMFELSDETEIAVIEMGMSEPGEMAKLATIARPETVIITNIGVSHIGQLGSRENIRKEKLSCIQEWTDAGTLYLNAEDALLREVREFSNQDQSDQILEKTMAALKVGDIVYYGLSFGEVKAEEIKTKGMSTSFLFADKEEKEEITLNVLGKHNVLNALSALLVAKQYNIPVPIAKNGLRDYQPIAMRGEIEQENGVYFINDTYNASPDSMKSGITVLLEFPNAKRKIAVLADVLELGENSYQYHYEVGSFICKEAETGKPIDLLLTVGPNAKAINDAVCNGNCQIPSFGFDTKEEAISYLADYLKPQDVVLVKGSRGMQMEKLVEAFKEQI